MRNFRRYLIIAIIALFVIGWLATGSLSVFAGCLPPHLRHVPCRHVPESAGAAAGDGPPRHLASAFALHGTRPAQGCRSLLAQSRTAPKSKNGLRFIVNTPRLDTRIELYSVLDT